MLGSNHCPPLATAKHSLVAISPPTHLSRSVSPASASGQTPPLPLRWASQNPVAVERGS